MGLIDDPAIREKTKRTSATLFKGVKNEVGFEHWKRFDKGLARDLSLFYTGVLYSREVISQKQRELCAVASLTVLHRPKELGIHIQAALNVGATRQEVAEATDVGSRHSHRSEALEVDAVDQGSERLRGEPDERVDDARVAGVQIVHPPRMLEHRGVLHGAPARPRQAVQQRTDRGRDVEVEHAATTRDHDRRQKHEVSHAGLRQLRHPRDDDAAHGVSDDEAAGDPRQRHRIGDATGIRFERRPSPLVGAPPVARQIHRQDTMTVALETTLKRLPAPAAVTHAVDEDEFLGHHGPRHEQRESRACVPLVMSVNRSSV